ncbi:hypothetical protein [Paraburkholderia mimosarum]|uniref:hypothetical protein n=1 Tax=Paraburkholderia mimosarum TaxID=312026 RepID=UPI00138E1F88|nr:hypothetical protein [Paraburkholderia mimosarum]
MKATEGLPLPPRRYTTGPPTHRLKSSGWYSGPLTGEHNHSYAWSLDYTEEFGQYLPGSIAWLNEEPIPDHRYSRAGRQPLLRYRASEGMSPLQ